MMVCVKLAQLWTFRCCQCATDLINCWLCPEHDDFFWWEDPDEDFMADDPMDYGRCPIGSFD